MGRILDVPCQLAIPLLLVACGSTAVSRSPHLAPPPPVARTVAPTLTGTRIAATARGALVIDADSGALLQLGLDGRTSARLAIGRGAGLLAFDPAREVAFVADRTADRLVLVDAHGTPRIVGQWKTPAEPFGVALTPDRQTVLVATIADRTLVAFDASTGDERWRAAISAGTRGVSISPDGTYALIASVATGALELVELAGAHRVASIPFDLACERCQEVGAFVRGTGAVRFIDEHRAVATFQRSIPEALLETNTGIYGGGSRPPVTQHVAFLTFSTDPSKPGVAQSVARIAENQPRPLAWDPAHDTLYVAGYGSDTLLLLPGLSRSDHDALEAQASTFVLRASDRCGPDGLALLPEGDLLVWCSFTRSVLRLVTKDLPHRADLTESPPLIESAFTPEQHRGLVTFYTTSAAVNRDRALACASCHVEGGADGLSWKIGTQALQTPSLAGRLTGTQPYRWDGSAQTLPQSLASTVHRLGGAGLDSEQSAALVVYLEALPRPRAPSRDPAAVARGKQVFDDVGGCIECHGGPTYSDGERHALTSTLEQADTPSLIGLSASGPYYHDGSAASLDELLQGGGTVHGMADMSKLDAAQRADLKAFLESL